MAKSQPPPKAKSSPPPRTGGMTKFKLGLAAAAATILAFDVVACGQQTTDNKD